MRKQMLIPLVCVAFTTNTSFASDFSVCHALHNDAQRLICYDQLTGRSLVAQGHVGRATARGDSAAQPATSSEQTPSVETERSSVAIDSENRFGLLPERSSIPMSLSARLAEVDRSRYGKMTLTLNNDQIWRQLDSSRLPLKVGDEVVITEASLGSHLLEKKSGSRSIRVKRIR